MTAPIPSTLQATQTAAKRTEGAAGSGESGVKDFAEVLAASLGDREKHGAPDRETVAVPADASAPGDARASGANQTAAPGQGTVASANGASVAQVADATVAPPDAGIGRPLGFGANGTTAQQAAADSTDAALAQDAALSGGHSASMTAGLLAGTAPGPTTRDLPVFKADPAVQARLTLQSENVVAEPLTKPAHASPQVPPAAMFDAGTEPGPGYASVATASLAGDGRRSSNTVDALLADLQRADELPSVAPGQTDRGASISTPSATQQAAISAAANRAHQSTNTPPDGRVNAPLASTPGATIATAADGSPFATEPAVANPSATQATAAHVAAAMAGPATKRIADTGTFPPSAPQPPTADQAAAVDTAAGFTRAVATTATQASDTPMAAAPSASRIRPASTLLGSLALAASDTSPDTHGAVISALDDLRNGPGFLASLAQGDEAGLLGMSLPPGFDSPWLMMRPDATARQLLASVFGMSPPIADTTDAPGTLTPNTTANSTAPAIGLSASAVAANDNPASNSEPARLSLPTPMVQSSRWGAELGDRIAWLAGNRVQSATLQVNPPQMGPIEVRIVIEGDQAAVSFAAVQSQTRDAIQQALPTLAQSFLEHGLQLARSNVGSDGHPAGFGQQARSEPRDDGLLANGRSSDASERGLVAVSDTLRPRNGLIDTFA